MNSELMKMKPILFSGPMVRAILDGSKTQTRRVAKFFDCETAMQFSPRFEAGFWKAAADGYQCKCPYGEVGDRLWVRETFCNAALPSYPTVYLYRADGETKPFGVNWRPSIFMPREACRITLEITGIRCERLNEISEADAIAEGITIKADSVFSAAMTKGKQTAAQLEYWHLWESINGPGSWEKNPFVWVVEFKRVEGSKI